MSSIAACPMYKKLLKESDGRNISMVNSKGEKRILNLGEALLFTSLDTMIVI